MVAEAQRIFIDWSKPLLKEVVGYLLGLGESEHRVDLSGYTLCLPTGRAGRRLMEMLVQACPAGRVLSPPRVTTPGQLPELLYASQQEVPEGFVARLARAHALETMDREVLKKLIPFPPGKGQTGLWLRLAGELERLTGELAADFKRPADVLEKLAGLKGEGLMYDDRVRWESVCAQEDAYARTMKKMGLLDRHHARFEAVERGEPIFAGQLMFVGAPGLSPLVKRMVDELVPAERVRVIVHAPQVLANRFDALGRLVVDVWAGQSVDVKDEQIVFANHPEEQARLVVGLIAHDCAVEKQAVSDKGQQISTEPGKGSNALVDTDQITVGLGDEAEGRAVGRALEAAGLSGRIAAGVQVRQARVCVMLDALATYLRERRRVDLARLVRCPDVESWLRVNGLDDKTPAENEHGRLPGSLSLLACLDESITRHLPMKTNSDWPGGLGADATARRVIELIDHEMAPPEWDKKRRMDLWVMPFIQMLGRVYGHRKLGNHVAEDQAVIRSLGELREICATVLFAEKARGVMGEVDFAGFMEAVLLGVESAIPAPSDPGSVELLGWLELPLDDAPNLIVTGFNDGFVPESVNHDAILPGSLRSAVGVADNTARLARDVYALSAILASREWVRLIACRRGADERPLTPSRLLIQTGDVTTVARRLKAFSDRESGGWGVEPPAGLVESGEVSEFLPPVPAGGGAQRTRFRVTEFADYAACPYRYYLKQIRKLSSQDDRAMEMDARAFGNLVHDVLRTFGKSDKTGETKAEKIEAFLVDALHERAREILGSHPPAPALIQLEIMKGRLAGFARAQAAEAVKGWRVVKELVEAPLEMQVALGDAENVVFHGTVDRVDYLPEAGFRVLDYKTGNEPKKPGTIYMAPKAQKAPKADAADAEGAYAWKDFQLPLYQKLLEGWARTRPEYAGKAIALGYFNLPRTADAAGVIGADWGPEAIERAFTEARTIAGLVRREVFWPPGPAPAYEDDFADLCHDNDIDRERALERVKAKLKKGGGA
jgi:ATP-dependent helicase/nuclease subunit B